MRILIAALVVMLGCSAAQAQTMVIPAPVPSTNLSGTIGTGGTTFQSIQVQGGRKGCLIQNNGANMMWVFFGPIASATKALSFQIQPPASVIQGGAVSCSNGTGVLSDQVSITGTSGDAFTANFQ